MAKIRAAVEADIPAMIAMGRALHAESPRYSYLTFSAEKVERLIRSMIDGTCVTEAPGGALVAELDGIVVGMIGGFITSPFFSLDRIASDYTFYIRPEQRGKGRIAVMLVHAFERWAIANGARDIIPGVSTMIAVDSTTALYEALGYQKYGVTLIKRVH